MKNLLIVILAFSTFNIFAHVDDLQKINKDSKKWGTPNCAECESLIGAKEAPSKLTKEQVKVLSLHNLKKMKPDFIESPPSDVSSWCPKYKSINDEKKLDFWSTLLTIMAKYESSYKPAMSYDESQTDRNLQGVVSMGLLQISFKSSQAKPYLNRGCPIKENKDLIDPSKNLACGIAILGHLMKRDGCLSCSKKSGAGAYWSVLRSPYTVTNRTTGRTMKIGKKEVIKKELSKETSYCH